MRGKEDHSRERQLRKDQTAAENSSGRGYGTAACRTSGSGVSIASALITPISFAPSAIWLSNWMAASTSIRLGTIKPERVFSKHKATECCGSGIAMSRSE